MLQYVLLSFFKKASFFLSFKNGTTWKILCLLLNLPILTPLHITCLIACFTLSHTVEYLLPKCPLRNRHGWIRGGKTGGYSHFPRLFGGSPGPCLESHSSCSYFCSYSSFQIRVESHSCSHLYTHCYSSLSCCFRHSSASGGVAVAVAVAGEGMPSPVLWITCKRTRPFVFVLWSTFCP